MHEYLQGIVKSREDSIVYNLGRVRSTESCIEEREITEPRDIKMALRHLEEVMNTSWMKNNLRFFEWIADSGLIKTEKAADKVTKYLKQNFGESMVFEGYRPIYSQGGFAFFTRSAELMIGKEMQEEANRNILKILGVDPDAPLPVYKKQSSKEFWEDSKGNFSIYDHRAKAVEKELRNLIKPSERIVNIMCGKYAHIQSDLGVDISEKALKSNKGIKMYLKADLSDPAKKQLDIPSSFFDTAVMISGIAYLEGYHEYVFSETQRILRPDGRFIIGFDKNYIHDDGNKWQKMNDSERLRFTQELFLKTGFGLQDVQVVHKDDIDNFYLITSRKKS